MAHNSFNNKILFYCIKIKNKFTYFNVLYKNITFFIKMFKIKNKKKLYITFFIKMFKIS